MRASQGLAVSRDTITNRLLFFLSLSIPHIPVLASVFSTYLSTLFFQLPTSVFDPPLYQISLMYLFDTIAGFEPQVMRIIDNARPDRQIVLFSATFPRQMEALARRLLVRPIEIQVGGRSVVGKDITQTIHVTEDDDQKYLKLLELLGLYCEQVIDEAAW